MITAGETRAVLNVDINNPPAIAIYEQLGFTPIGRRARYERLQTYTSVRWAQARRSLHGQPRTPAAWAGPDPSRPTWLRTQSRQR
jgi:ribosomal protein S18 acetylase RimI-like enzyme